MLPDDADALRALGRSIGLMSDPVKSLTDQWKQHAREVRRLHEKLFYRPLLEAVAALPEQRGPAHDRRGPAAARGARLRRPGRRAAPPRGADLGRLAPGRHPAPAAAGHARLVRRRARPRRGPARLPDRSATASGSSHWYLRMLRDEGAAAERLAHLLATSRYATDLLMRAPEATALLAHDDDLLPRDGRRARARDDATRRQRYTDPVEAIAAVRAVRRRELFRVAAADVFGLIDVDDGRPGPDRHRPGDPRGRPRCGDPGDRGRAARAAADAASP